jgi:hypothetical protein
MQKIRNVILMLLALLSGYQAFAQKKRFSVLPFPAVYYTPETRWAYGIALTSTFRFRNDSVNARPSQISLGIVFTQQKQSLYYVPFQVFLKNAAYYLYGELGFYRYTYFYFGIGNQPVPKELYGVDFPRVKISLLKKIVPHLYVGLRYQYEDYRITQTEPNGAFANRAVPGTPRSHTSGIGLGVFYDTRDVTAFLLIFLRIGLCCPKLSWLEIYLAALLGGMRPLICCLNWVGENECVGIIRGVFVMIMH